MIELPVQKRSGRLTKPNIGVDHRISSSLQRDRWIRIRLAAAQNSIAKSRSDTVSSEFSVTPSQPSRSERSEERRVGKECVRKRRSRRSPYDYNKNTRTK